MAKDEEAPLATDHRQSANPYLSKYGSNWLDHLKQSPSMSSYVCITDYVEFIINESSKVMKGSKHENDWLFYHDALSLMTARKTKEWMREKGYYDKWLLPTTNLYTETNSPDLLKRYRDNPIGNSPEFMPWDSHLNQDVHASHDHHVTLTRHLKDTDPRKFDGSTPKRMSASYHRLLTMVPTPNRVLEDCSRVLDSFEAVYNRKGVILDEYGARRGRRDVRRDDGKEIRGGSRQKKAYTRVENLHPDIASVKTEIFNKTTLTYYGLDDDNNDPMVGLQVQGEFDPDSSSVDVSDL